MRDDVNANVGGRDEFFYVTPKTVRHFEAFDTREKIFMGRQKFFERGVLPDECKNVFGERVGLNQCVDKFFGRAFVA